MNRRNLLRTAVATGVTAAGKRAFGEPAELTNLTLEEASAHIRNRSVSPVELTRACLDRIERLNPVLNAFITVTGEQALAQAREREAEQTSGRLRSPLHGVPIAVKDLIDTAGIRTTAASALFLDRVPTENAEVIRRLEAAGAVLLGKLNMDEFAYNFTSETSYFGPVHNPWSLDRTPGGSSGGAAAAVAAGLCYGALGSDTGGSIRQPAAFCGIAGLKASYGLVSTCGVVPLAWSLDHVGPMCRSVTGTAIMLQAIAGYDPKDTNSVETPLPDYRATLHGKISSLRLGIPRALFWEDLDPEIETAVRKAADLLDKMTAGTREIRLPPIGNLPVLSAEAYTYHEPYLAKSPEKYNSMTRQNILTGEKVAMPSYVRARRKLDRLRHAMKVVFAEVDLLLTPTTPRSPIRLEKGRVPNLILLRNAIPMNIYDLPTISIPCGFTRAGLPIGLQISAPRLGEPALLALAHAWEQATPWGRQKPVLRS